MSNPIAGNQFFTSVVNSATQLPELNVGECVVSNSNTVSAVLGRTEIKDGKLLTSQTTPPTVQVTGGFASGTIFANSTDIAGQVNLVGTAAAATTFTVTYDSPYPTPVQMVALTACDAAAATAVTNGVHVSSDSSSFTVTFVGASGANPCFNYFVIDPVSS
jgi:hypothetical protein